MFTDVFWYLLHAFKYVIVVFFLSIALVFARDGNLLFTDHKAVPVLFIHKIEVDQIALMDSEKISRQKRRTATFTQSTPFSVNIPKKPISELYIIFSTFML